MQSLPFRMLLAIAMVAILHLCTTDVQSPDLHSINDKSAHLLAFYVLAWLVDFSFPESGYRLHKILPLLGYGLLIEGIQYFLPHRTASILDLTADAAGLLLYGLSLPLLRCVPLIRRRWTAT